MTRRARSSGKSGQTVVEFVLTLTISITLVAIIGNGFRKTMFGLWTFFTREISAACPGCPPDPSIRMR